MRTILSLLLLLNFGIAQTFAHGDNRHFANKQDVKVTTVKVSGNVYMLQGRGGNIGAVVGPDGILIVDDDYKAVSQKLSDALKELGSATPRFIFNTHWHTDHTEGNQFFGKDSIIVAHENVRKRMIDPPIIFGEKTAPYASIALPIVTYTESMSIHINGEEIKAVHYPNGHTDGDTIVFFIKANVVHLGDDFFVGRFPFVDLDSGGSVQGLINNIANLIQTIPADAKLIPGHGPLSTHNDLKAYHQALVETSKFVQDEMKKKKPLDEIKKGGLPEKYKEFGSGFIKTEFWIETVYKSYSKK
ncbi:MAG: MBL fold metallo-hydrolase [Saprospiraceae bacterium]|nr:MBL fold metallo-hydrolase [Pyrinomonadaceae bacterium]